MLMAVASGKWNYEWFSSCISLYFSKILFCNLLKKKKKQNAKNRARNMKESNPYPID